MLGKGKIGAKLVWHKYCSRAYHESCELGVSEENCSRKQNPPNPDWRGAERVLVCYCLQ